ncbi:MAG: 50S ribosomal protein L10 [Clostridiales bacterium]|nr:50S ribosomal protein L10 [Clostridiales bacterium]
MSNNLALKKQAVEEISQKFDQAQSVIVVKYSGLTVEKATELRSKCREAGVEYVVYKNTLVRRALENLGIDSFADKLTGPTAYAFGANDAVAPAKVINDFIVKNKTEAVKIEGGLLGKEYMDLAQVKALAAMPSREELLAKLLGSMTNTIGSFVRVVDAIRKQKAEAEGAEA